MTSHASVSRFRTSATFAVALVAFAGCAESKPLGNGNGALTSADAGVTAGEDASSHEPSGPICPAIACLVACPNGQVKDASGCATCQCLPGPDAGAAADGPRACPLIACPAIACANWYAQDSGGCPTCRCNPSTDPTTDPCASVRCAAGTVCQAHQVECVRAPCPPIAECVPEVRCGGIAARPCPGAGVCQDDPSDSCDPAHGGADCGGLCVCKPIPCPSGRTFDGSPKVCACVAN